ncbi:MAG: flap endonuclease-1 [Candidatus Woesearchaeota archaeon]|nr:flap endonuclease-1 [Candidatus Woesearchaeota archaeon]
MGTKLKDIVIKKEIEYSELSGKVFVVDSFNVLYQFLTTIRMADGSPLMDSKGNITSHLNGIFYRSLNLMAKGLKLAFVFDGEAPSLKKKERERRKELKEEAKVEYEIAKEREDVEGMKKYAGRTSTLTDEMVEEVKKLIKAMGMPVIEAPSEGEAQAAHIVKNGDAFAEISQDFDCLMFGVPRLVRNLTTSEKRKMPGKLGYITIKPEIIELEENLKNLGISQDQLIALCMLIGTDYNVGGIKGIGPKHALKFVKEYPKVSDFDALFSKVEWDKYFEYPWKEVFNTIKNMPTSDKYELKWKSINKEAIKKLLVEEHDFSEKRIEESLEKFEKEKEKQSQRGLSQFF